MKRVDANKNYSLCVQPTFLIGTYDEEDVPNFTPITWVSVTYHGEGYWLVISMFGSKKAKLNVNATGKLSANLVSCDMLPLLDYFGSCSGKDGKKDAMPYEWEEGRKLHVPTLSASRWVYECEVEKTVQTGESHTYFCRMANVQIPEDMQDAQGLDLTRLDPVIYSRDYHSLGRHLGVIGDFYKAPK